MEDNNKIKKKENKHIASEMIERFTALITSGFGLVAALAWNDAIQALFRYLFPGQRGELSAKLIYAVFITLIVVIIVYELTRLKKMVNRTIKKTLTDRSTKKSYFAIIKMRMQKLGHKKKIDNKIKVKL